MVYDLDNFLGGENICNLEDFLGMTNRKFKRGSIEPIELNIENGGFRFRSTHPTW